MQTRRTKSAVKNDLRSEKTQQASKRDKAKTEKNRLKGKRKKMREIRKGRGLSVNCNRIAVMKVRWVEVMMVVWKGGGWCKNFNWGEVIKMVKGRSGLGGENSMGSK